MHNAEALHTEEIRYPQGDIKDCGTPQSLITLVTAFFDIGRAGAAVYPRTNEQYFQYFDFWARIQNDLIVYCAPENAERIRSIRAGYGREEHTRVIPVPDVFAIEPEIYEKMKSVEALAGFHDFRYFSPAMSNGADYDYLMMLKYWFVWDAAQKYLPEGTTAAWLDFGYNHGGAYYTCPEDFDIK